MPEFEEFPSSTYLGDGLYASYDGYQVQLAASDGIRNTNVVYLDPSVLNAFMQYVRKLQGEVT